jgi:cell division protein FtsB
LIGVDWLLWTLSAAQGLSTLYSSDDNTLSNRRKLKSVLERRSVSIHKALVRAYSSVATELASVTATVQALHEDAQKLSARLAETKRNNAVLIRETSDLQAQRSSLTTTAISHAYLCVLNHVVCLFGQSDSGEPP